jgi:hypothetical protein
MAGMARYRVQCEGRDGVDLAEEAVALARRAGVPADLSAALEIQFIALQAYPRPALQRELAEELLSLARESTERRRLPEALRVCCVAAIGGGNLEQFHHYLDELRDVANALGHWRYNAMAEVLSDQLRFLQGDFEASGRNLALEATSVDDPDVFQYQLVMALALAWAKARFDEGQVLALGPAVEGRPNLAEVAQVGAIALQAVTGEFEQGEALLRSMVADGRILLPRGIWWAPMLQCVTEILGREIARDSDAVDLVLDALLPYTGQLILAPNTVISLGSGDRYLGMLMMARERWDDAEQYFVRALDIESRLGAETLLAQTRFWYGRTLLRRDRLGDRGKGVELIRDALAAAHAMDFHALDVLVREMPVEVTDFMPPQAR